MKYIVIHLCLNANNMFRTENHLSHLVQQARSNMYHQESSYGNPIPQDIPLHMNNPYFYLPIMPPVHPMISAHMMFQRMMMPPDMMMRPNMLMPPNKMMPPNMMMPPQMMYPNSQSQSTIPKRSSSAKSTNKKKGQGWCGLCSKFFSTFGDILLTNIKQSHMSSH